MTIPTPAAVGLVALALVGPVMLVARLLEPAVRPVPVCLALDVSGNEAAIRGIERWGNRVERRKLGEQCAVTVQFGQAATERPEACAYTAWRSTITIACGSVEDAVAHEWGHVLGLHD